MDKLSVRQVTHGLLGYEQVIKYSTISYVDQLSVRQVTRRLQSCEQVIFYRVMIGVSSQSNS